MIRKGLLFSLASFAWMHPSNAVRYGVSLWGDLPYVGDSPNVFVDNVKLNGVPVGTLYTKLAQSMNAFNPAFSFHVGDVKYGNVKCSDPYYARFEQLTGAMKCPVVYTPGDNDWTDCWSSGAGRYDPIERLSYIRGRFYPPTGPLVLGTNTGIFVNGTITVPNATYPENRIVVYGQIVYIVVHAIGSNNGKYKTVQHPADWPCSSGLNAIDPGCQRAYAEYIARNTANLNLIRTGFQMATSQIAKGVVVTMQANMFNGPCDGNTCSTKIAIDVLDGFRDTWNQLKTSSTAFRNPVLLVHGDFHYYQDFIPDPTVPNLRAVQVPGEESIGWVSLTVNTDTGPLFTVANNPIK